MNSALLGARLLLSAVFLVAALAKVVDRSGSRQALQNFGVPALFTAPLVLLLPLAELAIALALLPRLSGWWGALGALALLVLFIMGIGLNLARGRTPDCHCFGQLHSAPMGWATLTRNGVLTGVAGFVVWQGRTNAGLSAVSWLGALTAAQRVELIAGVVVVGLLVIEGRLLLHLLGQNGRLLVRLAALEGQLATGGIAPAAALAEAPAQPVAGLPVGAPAPAFALAGLYGETLTLEALRAPGKPVLLLFSDPGCGPCTALLPEIGRWQREHAATLALALISRGSPEANRSKITEHGVIHVLLQEDREVAQAYQAKGTPGAVLVRPGGTIGSPLALGADAIRTLVARTVWQPTPLPMLPAAPAGGGNGHAPELVPPTAPKMGDPAPALALPDLTGKTIDLAAFQGRRTLVLFWNPSCGFCQQMLDELKAWESARPKDAPQLLVVSTGTVEANQALGLRAPVMLDQDFTAGRAFGANGTPMAVLVDAKGRMASEVAAGGPAVLALARDGQAQAQAGPASR